MSAFGDITGTVNSGGGKLTLCGTINPDGIGGFQATGTQHGTAVTYQCEVQFWQINGVKMAAGGYQSGADTRSFTVVAN
jgi:hypothetical protein